MRLKFLRISVIVVLTVIPALCHGQAILKSVIPDPAVPAQQTSITLASCQAPPKIDGDLGDDCWKTATHADGFYRFWGTTPISEQTEAWLCADRDHLYVAFHCIDNHPNLIHAVETVRDGDIGDDDNVSVEIDSQNTHRDASSFTVSARGTQGEWIEGGTADNITWAGDWKAAAMRVPDGWTAEFAIPFALLRYPPNTHSMGILLQRKLARETSPEGWPYMPRDEQQHSIQYLTTFTGIEPEHYAPHPVFLPYNLVTGGEGYNGQEGLDIKYPFTTTMTGLVTVNPDFQDVAQEVTNINFSYNPKYYGDSRPFFAEGSGYMPYSDVFYSRAIGDIDEGVKVTGRQGQTTLAALATDSHTNGGRSDVVASMFQDFGALSSIHFAMAQDQQAGLSGSRVVKMEGVYGWEVGKTRYSITANHLPSWVDNHPSDASDFIAFQTNPLNGKPYVSLDWNDIGPKFTNNIGYVPDRDSRGGGMGIGQTNSFDHGLIDYYSVNLGGSYFDRHTGGFYNKAAHVYGFLSFRSGWNTVLSVSRSQRFQYRDHVDSIGVNWGTRTLYSHGGISYDLGRQADQRYGYLSVYQGYPLNRNVTINANVNRLLFGDSVTTQTVLSGTYRLSSERSIGIQSVSIDHDTNLFVSFAQKVRVGEDIYVLVGDPNSQTTRGLVTVKIVSPF